MNTVIRMKSGENVYIYGLTSIKAMMPEKTITYTKKDFSEFVCRSARSYTFIAGQEIFAVSGEDIRCVHFSE